MNKLASRLTVAVFCAVSSLCVSARPAEAARLPFIFNSGQKIFRTGPLPEPFDKEEELKGYDAGYACDIKGVMWSYYSVSNCRPVAFQGDTYIDEEQLVSAIQAKYPESSMQRGFWGHYGWMLFVLALVGGLAVWIKELMTGKRKDGGSGQNPAQDPSQAPSRNDDERA